MISNHSGRIYNFWVSVELDVRMGIGVGVGLGLGCQGCVVRVRMRLGLDIGFGVKVGVSLPYLSQVEEGDGVAGVGEVAPALLSRVVELHVSDLGHAFRKST